MADGRGHNVRLNPRDKKHRPCLVCGKMMMTDSEHRICKKCHRNDHNRLDGIPRAGSLRRLLDDRDNKEDDLPDGW